MSDQSLREALEELVEADLLVSPSELRALLALHPAEPAPVYQETELDAEAWPSALSAYERGENPCPGRR